MRSLFLCFFNSCIATNKVVIAYAKAFYEFISFYFKNKHVRVCKKNSAVVFFATISSSIDTNFYLLTKQRSNLRFYLFVSFTSLSHTIVFAKTSTVYTKKTLNFTKRLFFFVLFYSYPDYHIGFATICKRPVRSKKQTNLFLVVFSFSVQAVKRLVNISFRFDCREDVVGITT